MIKFNDLINKLSPNLDDYSNSPERKQQRETKCQWNTNVEGIKIFFDITDAFNYKEKQTLFGTAIMLAAALKTGKLSAVNHVGFVLKDGRLLDATTSEGVKVRSGDDLKEFPHNFVCVNVGGSEAKLLQEFVKIKKELSDKSYDTTGIYRQIPLIGKLFKHLKWTKEHKSDAFFCSELVANLLVRSGVLSVEDLKNAMKENVSELDVHDEVDPTTLYNLVKNKAELLPKVCHKP